jgi:hypothetical protein
MSAMKKQGPLRTTPAATAARRKPPAIHPGCGTNYLTSGAAASLGILGVLSIGDRKARWSRWPDAMIAATLALIIAQPIGPKLQEHVTTCGDMGDLEIVAVRRLGPKAHYVETHST